MLQKNCNPYSSIIAKLLATTTIRSMSYKEKFKAAENKAHYKNIATKISRDMMRLRSEIESSPTTSRRWVWELIQNAKDVAHSGGVNIRIDYKRTSPTPKLIFKHDGRPFSADNIRFLIEQISSKEREKDESGKQKNSGKFGTGFLTTHTLSEIVTVKGVAKEPGLDYRQFKMHLDRTGYELADIMEAVEKAKNEVANLDELPAYTNYKEEDLNTVFIYPLNDSIAFEVANHGLNDLENCLPYSLCFVNEINSLEDVSKGAFYYKADTREIAQGIHLITINIERDNEETPTEVAIVQLSKGFTSIAVPVTVSEEKITLDFIKLNVPKLFCDFPLIGTDDFPFPVIINSPNFNPTEPRDGVFLTDTTRANPQVQENKSIIADAINLYFKLLEFAASEDWGNLHLLANINGLRNNYEWISNRWYEEQILTPVRMRLLKAKIIRTATGSLSAILNEDNKPLIYFPSGSTKEIRQTIWEVANYLFPQRLPANEDIELWNKLIWKDCEKLTLERFAEFVEMAVAVKNLGTRLKGIDGIEWLNRFYKMLQLDEKEYHTIIDKRAIVPNQNGDFVKRSQLDEDSGDIEDVFKDILMELGNDIRRTLADKDINIELDEIADQAFVIREITTEVNDKTSDREVAKSFRKAFNLLLIFFKNYPEKSQQLFPLLYKKKHLLYDDEEIENNIEKAELLDGLLTEFNVASTADLRSLLLSQRSDNEFGIMPVTQEIIMSMGITSLEEWKKALEDKDLKALFAHSSVPTYDMFVYAQTHIASAKKAIIEHLKKLQDYDLSEMDEDTAPTILAGIYKHGQPLSIVTRPAYNDEVIIYYGSERDVLDYEPSELWIEDAFEVRRISMGHILKTAQIRKFPV